MVVHDKETDTNTRIHEHAHMPWLNVSDYCVHGYKHKWQHGLIVMIFFKLYSRTFHTHAFRAWSTETIEELLPNIDIKREACKMCVEVLLVRHSDAWVGGSRENAVNFTPNADNVKVIEITSSDSGF